MSQRIEAESVAGRRGDGVGAEAGKSDAGPGVRLFIPAKDLPELFEALEVAADTGDYMRVDHLLVKLDKVIQLAAEQGEPWAQRILARLDETPAQEAAIPLKS